MVEWAYPMLGSGFIGLIAIIYALQTGRINKIERWIEGRPSKEEVLTRSDHLTFCSFHSKELLDSIDKSAAERTKVLKEHLDTSMENLSLRIKQLCDRIGTRRDG